MDYDVLAFIGRFQFFTDAHREIVETALKRSKKVAMVLGSHDQPRDSRNPFTTSERIQMISAVFPEEVATGRLHFVPMVDHTYNLNRWISGVQAGVSTVANTPFTPDPVKIGLIGHAKDHTSFYLKSFPTWGSVNVENYAGLNATDLRREYFNGTYDGHDAPAEVFEFLEAFKLTPAYAQIVHDIQFESLYKKGTHPQTPADVEAFIAAEGFDAAAADAVRLFHANYGVKYAPTFHTVDAVVTQSGHVLLIERKAAPGEGLWALPGGFLDPQETLRAGMLRELREETNIALSDETLNRCIRSWQTFDEPNRSRRGRTITTAFRIELRDDVALTKIKGGDDAAKAQWVPLAQVSRNVMFEDHYDIIENMVSI